MRPAVRAVCVCAWACLWACLGGPGVRPAAAAAPEAAARSILVLYSAPRVTFGLGQELEFLNLLLRRSGDSVKALPWAEATRGVVEGSSRVVVFCPEAVSKIPTNTLQLLSMGLRPVLWVGHLPEAWASRPELAGKIDAGVGGLSQLGPVTYRGRTWEVGEAEWIPMRWRSGEGGETAAAWLTLPGETAANGLAASVRAPGWSQGTFSYFSAIPAPNRLGFLLADRLLDFLGGEESSASRLLLRLDDYQAGGDLVDFQRKVDFLYSRGQPFLVSVIPSWRVAPTGAVVNLDAAPEYVNGLRYAQSRGGALFLGGCVRGETEPSEFWDAAMDRPLSRPLAESRRRMEVAVALLLKQGLLPIGWSTPRYAAARAVYQEVGRHFSTSMERLQLSDLTERETALLSVATRDRDGRQVLPENLGFVAGDGSNAIPVIQAQARFITGLRGTIAGVVFHAYVPMEKLTALVTALEQVPAPFLDPAGMDHWVHVPGRLLLTGAASQSVKLAGGVVTWKAWDRQGQLLATEQDFALPGERLLRRKGKGIYEVYEFNEVTP